MNVKFIEQITNASNPHATADSVKVKNDSSKVWLEKPALKNTKRVVSNHYSVYASVTPSLSYWHIKPNAK